jgi:hypothetical protein
MHATFAAIALPLWLVVSQWTLLFALGFLVIVMYRQVGFLQNLKNINSEQEGLPIGEKAPMFNHTPVKEGASASTGFASKGHWTLLLFLDPGCVSCQNTLRTLEQMAPQLGQAVQVLVVTSAEPPVIAAVDTFRASSLDISRVSSDVSTRLYRTRITPFGYLIDPEGSVRAKGIAADGGSIQKMLRKVDRSATKVELTNSRK